MKKENGITLIALVITIIVLLILAGVSISLVVGDNGVLTQATNAVSKNREATAMEDVSMAWASATSEYWTDWATDSSKNITDYRTKAKLDSYLVGKGHLEGNPKYNDANKEYTINYRADDQNELYTFLMTEDGNARKKTGVVLDNSELYIALGKTKTLTAKLVDMDEGTITWTSSDTSKATVSDGVVTGVAKGTVTITATCNGKSDTCLVTVADTLISKVNVGDYVNINVGYEDKMNTNNYTGDNIGKAWRVVSKNETSGEVKLISTGHPLTFYQPSNPETSEVIELITIESGIITIQSSNSSMGYQSSGFNPGNMSGLFDDASLFNGISLVKSIDEFDAIPSRG